MLGRLRSGLSKAWHSRRQGCYDFDLSFSEAVTRFPDRNALYMYMHHYFCHRCPKQLRAHRSYFDAGQRGFGENAFHAMWWLLLREFKPRSCLEIGVYRGQTISLWSLCAQLLEIPCEIHALSPFCATTDTVSRYRPSLDYLEETLNSFKHFQLPAPKALKAYSTDPQAAKYIQRAAWDLIFVDGSHDFEIVLADYQLCREALAPGGLLVFDDASLGTSYRPLRFAFAGHPGPSRVVAEYASKELRFLGAVGHNNVFRK